MMSGVLLGILVTSNGWNPTGIGFTCQRTDLAEWAISRSALSKEAGIGMSPLYKATIHHAGSLQGIGRAAKQVSRSETGAAGRRTSFTYRRDEVPRNVNEVAARFSRGAPESPVPASPPSPTRSPSFHGTPRRGEWAGRRLLTRNGSAGAVPHAPPAA